MIPRCLDLRVIKTNESRTGLWVECLKVLQPKFENSSC